MSNPFDTMPRDEEATTTTRLRLNIHIARHLAEALHYGEILDEGEAQLVFDILVDGLARRSDDEVMGLLRTSGGGIYAED